MIVTTGSSVQAHWTARSEEHTSELQSRENVVCRLLVGHPRPLTLVPYTTLFRSTTSVKWMLDGSQPRWPVPRLVAKVLSRHLHREISVTECGFADRTPASDDRYDGLQCSGTLDG